MKLSVVACIGLVFAGQAASAQRPNWDRAYGNAEQRYMRVCAAVDPDEGCACKARNLRSLPPNHAQTAPFLYALSSAQGRDQAAILEMTRNVVSGMGWDSSNAGLSELFSQTEETLGARCDQFAGVERGNPVSASEMRSWSVFAVDESQPN